MVCNPGELSVQAGQQVELIDTREEQVTLEYFGGDYFWIFPKGICWNILEGNIFFNIL